MPKSKFAPLLAAMMATIVTVAAKGDAPSSSSANFNRPADVQAVSRKEMDVQLVGNVDELMAMTWRYVASAGYDSNGGWSEGWENIYDSLVKEYQAVSGGSHKPTVAERYKWIEQINIATDGKIACVAMFLDIPFRKNGQMTSIKFPEFDVWRKFNNSWLAVQLHTYLPVDPLTGKATNHHDLPDRGLMQWSDNPLPGPAGDPVAAESELRAWLTTRTTTTDLDRLMALFGPGDDVMAFGPVIPIERRGLQEIRQHLAGQLADVRSISTEIKNFKVQSNGLMSAILARQIVTMTMKDGTTRRTEIRNSNCLRRVGDGWRSMIEVVSYPSNVPSSLQ